MLKRWVWKWLGVGKLEMQVVKDIVDLRAVLAKQRVWVAEFEKRLGECEKELELEGPEENGSLRRRKMWMAELEKQGLSVEEKREWESGM